MTRANVQDDVLYCGRCGISFLWSQEEQRAAPEDGTPPHFCPACRRLLPAAGREVGMVKWYDRRKQYGFIVRTGQPDLYVHRSGVETARLLQPGDLVEFAVSSTPRGPAATEVVVITPTETGAA